jgi:DNA-binding protein YbaB
VPHGADRDANSALKARFAEVYGQYERLRAGMDELQTRLAALRVTAESDDGCISATVGPRGQLVDLDLDPDIYLRPDAERLAREITRTVQEATSRAVDQVQRLVADYLPDGSPAVDFLKDNNFGTLLRRQDAVMREGEAADD